ncbi:La-related protein 6A [Hibiscus syriacus]|uniref:La-related protein 6A n=1 Tax=Hibiscus syriacus TaxID=106335 RepID=A0A6A3BJH2_HIBSY|nr:la-related protein 6A-like [Hibiscus syriacus]KAE8715202.1 La-related protein 6A [Hibiscus syriacus]
MDRHGDPTPAAADDDSIRRSPLDDPLDFIPVGSPEEEILYPPTDEDHDPDHNGHRNDDEHGQVHDQNPEVYSATDVLTDDLKKKIIKQAEYYFSDEKLPTDKYMMGLIKRNKEGFVLISEISSFRKMKKLTRNYPSIVAALKESSLLVVSSDGKKVKRRNPLPIIEVRDPKVFTVLVENLPEDHSVENIKKIFGEVGRIKKISIRDPHAIEESKKSGRADILISSKLHALVEFETVEAAEKAVTTLNNEHDWRNGMHVKLLERMGTHGQRKQARRGSAPEKNSNARAPDQTGNEENNISSEHHEDIPYDEDGEHLPKEKNGQRYRNRGRGRRQKNHGTNGLGHGTTSSCHALELSKPPPGPRMPDGTRGFTMGRGRPLLS